MAEPRALRVAALGITAVAVTLTAVGAHGPLRVAAVLLYMAAVPGYAVVRRIGLTDPVLVGALSVTTSLAVCLLLSLVLLAVGWLPEAAFVGLAAASTALLVTGRDPGVRADPEVHP